MWDRKPAIKWEKVNSFEYELSAEVPYLIKPYKIKMKGNTTAHRMYTNLIKTILREKIYIIYLFIYFHADLYIHE